jgi:serine/threonine protein kinase
VSRTQADDVAPPGLPGYRFISNIGSGGNAQVYLYEQDLPHRKVAVKVLNESALSEAARRRFTTEANVTAGLAHRHIVQVFDANVTPDGRPYIVMPYYPQPNLSVRARRSHFSVADVLRTGIQIGSAVETSHQHGVLHRDIKPQNILTDSYGEPALTDFGIATTTGGDGPEGLSVPWSPPEILYGTAPGDQRSDVYSLGATLWHLLTGRSPFEEPGGDNSTYALMRRIKSDAPPRTQRADVPDSLERLLRQSMAKDAAARPQSAMELIRGLQSVEQELRLPLTQPILPAGERPGDTRGGDTIVRARARESTLGPGGGTGPVPQDPQQSWGQTIMPPWGAAADPRPHGTGTGARPAAWAGADDDETRTRGPVRLDPRGTEGRPQDDPTRARAPMRLDPRGGTTAGGGPGSTVGAQRPWEFAPETQDAATYARPTMLRPNGPVTAGAGAARGQQAFQPGSAFAGAGQFEPGGQFAPAGQFGTGGQLGTGGQFGTDTSFGTDTPFAASGQFGAGTAAPRLRARGLLLTLAAGGTALVVAVVAYLAIGRGHGQPGSAPTGPGQATSSGGAQNALGPAVDAPGPPVVTAKRVSATKIRFHWTYTNHRAGDTFLWRRVSGSAGSRAGRTGKPELFIKVPAGQNLCIEVEVVRLKGQVSNESAPGCWPS